MRSASFYCALLFLNKVNDDTAKAGYTGAMQL